MGFVTMDDGATPFAKGSSEPRAPKKRTKYLIKLTRGKQDTHTDACSDTQTGAHTNTRNRRSKNQKANSGNSVWRKKLDCEGFEKVKAPAQKERRGRFTAHCYYRASLPYLCIVILLCYRCLLPDRICPPRPLIRRLRTLQSNCCCNSGSKCFPL